MRQKIIQKLRILKARIKIKSNKYPAKFEPNKWDTYRRADCYMYALDIRMDMTPLVGDFINKRITPKNISKLMETLIQGLNVLGFRLAKPGEKNVLKLCLHINKANIYHFIRRDQDGGWPEKFCGTIPQKESLSDLENEGGSLTFLYLKKK